MGRDYYTLEELKAKPGSLFVGISRWGHWRWYTWDGESILVLEEGVDDDFRPSVLSEKELEQQKYILLRS